MNFPVTDIHAHIGGIFPSRLLFDHGRQATEEWLVSEDQRFLERFGERSPFVRLLREARGHTSPLAVLQRAFIHSRTLFRKNCRDPVAHFLRARLPFDIHFAHHESQQRAAFIRDSIMDIVSGTAKTDWLEVRAGYTEDWVSRWSATADGILEAQRRAGKGKLIRFVVSLAPPVSLAWKQYHDLRAQQLSNPRLRTALVGVDFAGDHAKMPPRLYRGLLRTIRQDNRYQPANRFGVTFHSGECWARQHVSIETAIRWIIELVHFGVDRIGHGVVLGIDPAYVHGSVISENRDERIKTIEFLLEHMHEFSEHSLFSKRRLQNQLTQSLSADGPVRQRYTTLRLRQIRALQAYAMDVLARRKTIIEVCPTSNISLCHLANYHRHPLQKFLRQGLRVAVGTDNPNYHRTTVLRELRSIQRAQRLTDAQVNDIQRTGVEAFFLRPRDEHFKREWLGGVFTS